MNETQDKLGDTIPLYEEVKRNLYKLSQELKNISSMILRSNNSTDYYLHIKLFNENYIKFYIEVSTNKKITKLENKQVIYLKKAYVDIIKGKNINKIQISKINIIIATLIESLGISKIGSNQKDSWAF
jgi:hypothetical protein